MSFYSAFPTSPLSRSALEADSSSDRASAFKPFGSRRSPAQSASAVPIDPSRPDLPSMRKFASRVPLADTMPSSLGLGHPAVSPNSSSRHVSGPARLMRSPNASAWSPSLATPFDELAVSPPFASSSFSRSINTRRRSSGYSFSGASGLTPNFGSLVGSFQESLLSGRMSMPASKPLVFDAEIGVLGAGKCRPSLRCPPHLHVKFPAHFYDLHAIDARPSAATPGSTAALGSPYVGTVDLESHYTSLLLSKRFSHPSVQTEPGEIPSFPGYAVPPKGQIQLIVKYPDLAAVKLFLVPYDLTDMHPGTKTFVRQKTVVRPAAETAQQESSLGTSEGSQSQSRTSPKEALRFAIHLQFCCPPMKSRRHDSLAGFEGSDTRRFRSRGDAAAKQPRAPRIYLHKSIRLVFGARALDAGEKLVDNIETPGTGGLRFSAYQGPDEEWVQLQEEMKALQSSMEPGSAAVPVSEASSGTESVRMGLGIDIQAPSAGHSRDAGEELSNLVPLNSDPNGERWQASVSSSIAAAAPQDGASAMPASLRSTWTVSSQESSLGRAAPSWPAPQQEQHGVGHLTRTLASSHLSDSWADQRQHRTIRVRSTAESEAPASASSTAASRRPSRMRSASAAGLSEPRVHSVSALGELQEVAAPPSQSSIAPDPANSMLAWKASGIASKSGDRPSLLRKLSEQFARTHSPSPTNSPRLTPARRHELDEMHIDEVAPMDDSHSRSIR